ncbi:M48 family metalloprotease [Robertkochia solimangrovi]|uniref:M48 family metalloprotease n=1 Tax=Robertkochia solimangrovi TaxID=2213046 RepID=UPI00117E8B1E|nr:M48 family metallopeptidase [Robertkochia solimangrovi]TRZ43189.1 hypothetical protein DMZ48_10880 [Robertkochia solimangrovi]
MNKLAITPSPSFQQQTKKAIGSIILFVASYVLIFLLSIAITIVCVYGSYIIITQYFTLITVAFGLGLASLGFLILIFLIKFIFTSKKTDLSGYIEVKVHEEPELFAMIEEIVTQVGTEFPKKVYLSSEVNASVFYNSNFWSMFFPVRKNLHIGMGLINSITTSELKAILSHEFGHFSQESMKVSSYVYNVNQVIYNMLFENDSYFRMVHNWAKLSGIISIFVIVAVKINQGIQYLLQQLYAIVNKSYLSLSREMEFHADEIAAHITGYEPLQDSLLRMNMAEFALNNVFQFYETKVEMNEKSENIFSEQTHIMFCEASESALEMKHGFPVVSLEELNRYNKSKLVINNQWSSHPELSDRIENLKKKGKTRSIFDNRPANSLFKDVEKIQKKLTELIFKNVTYTENPKATGFDQFKQEYAEYRSKTTFSRIYNGYYDYKNPVIFNYLEMEGLTCEKSVNELFSDETVDIVYNSIAIKNDIETLKMIADRTIRLKTFDYDGVRYTRKDINALIERLQTEQKEIEAFIEFNDRAIFSCFRDLAKTAGDPHKLINLYQDYFKYDSAFDEKIKVITELRNKLQFISENTEMNTIKLNFLKVASGEKELRTGIENMLKDNLFTEEISMEMKSNFETYISRERVYFAKQTYIEKNLEILFKAINDYEIMLNKGYFLLKKKMLAYQISLTDTHSTDI